MIFVKWMVMAWPSLNVFSDFGDVTLRQKEGVSIAHVSLETD